MLKVDSLLIQRLLSCWEKMELGRRRLLECLLALLKPDNDQEDSQDAVSMKPQKISPKFQGDVRSLFLKKVFILIDLCLL